MSQTQQQSGGIGFPGALTILFIALKLTHVIGWSWWWVLSPLLIATGFWVAVLLVIFVFVIIAMAFDR